MRHNEQCTGELCCRTDSTLDSGTDRASHSYVIQAYGILGLVRQILDGNVHRSPHTLYQTHFGVFL